MLGAVTGCINAQEIPDEPIKPQSSDSPQSSGSNQSLFGGSSRTGAEGGAVINSGRASSGGGGSRVQRRSSGGSGGGGSVSADYSIGFGPNGAYRDYSDGGEGGYPINLGPIFGDVTSITMGASLGSHFLYRGQDLLRRYTQADRDNEGGMAVASFFVKTNRDWSFSFEYLTSMQSDYIFPPSKGGLTPDSRLGAYSEANFTVAKEWGLGGGFFAGVSNEFIYFPQSDAWDSSFMNGISAKIGQRGSVSDQGKYEFALVVTQFLGQSEEVMGTGLTLQGAYQHQLGQTSWFGKDFDHTLTLRGEVFADKNFTEEKETGLGAADIALIYGIAMGNLTFTTTAGYSFDLTDSDAISNTMRDGAFVRLGAAYSF